MSLPTFRNSLRRFRKSERRRPVQGVPSFESLESRVLLSVAADFDEVTGTLTLTGDAAADHVRVSPGDSDGRVVVRVEKGFDHDSDPLTDKVRKHVFEGVNALVIDTDGGKDKIRVQNGLRTAAVDGETLIPVTVVAGDGKDVVFTGDGDDDIDGGAGKDVIRSGEGDDIVNGGDDKDNIRGGDGNDQLSGDDGNDNIRGGRGDDELDGDGGNDNLRGNDGADDLDGGEGDDNLDGNTDGDVDTVHGGDGDDKISDGGSDGGSDIVSDGDDDAFVEVEPNGTTAEADANTQTLGDDGELKLEGTVSPNDDASEIEDNVDLYAVNITSAGTLEIEAEVPGTDGQPIKVELLAADGMTVLATVDVNPADDNEAEGTVEILAPGTYYIRVTTTGTAAAPYEVELDLDNDPDGDTDGNSDGESDGDSDGGTDGDGG